MLAQGYRKEVERLSLPQLGLSELFFLLIYLHWDLN